MDSAPRLPAATASITVAGPPPTASPPAKTPGRDVSHVSSVRGDGAPAGQRHASEAARLGQPADRDDHGIDRDRELAVRESAPDGRRPDASGSPSAVRTTLTRADARVAR